VFKKAGGKRYQKRLAKGKGKGFCRAELFCIEQEKKGEVIFTEQIMRGGIDGERGERGQKIVPEGHSSWEKRREKGKTVNLGEKQSSQKKKKKKEKGGSVAKGRKTPQQMLGETILQKKGRRKELF